MALADNAWTTLSATQEYLGLSTADGKDDLLENLIERYSDSGRTYIGRDPFPSDYIEYHDGFGQDTVVCDHWPILQVNALSDDGSAVGVQGVDWHVYPNAGLIALDAGKFSRKRRGIYASLYAGLSPWPHPDLEQACIWGVQDGYAARGTGSSDTAGRVKKSEAVGRYAVTWENAVTGSTDNSALDLPRRSKAILDRWRSKFLGGVR
jgi:hypothetical protein